MLHTDQAGLDFLCLSFLSNLYTLESKAFRGERRRESLDVQSFC